MDSRDDGAPKNKCRTVVPNIVIPHNASSNQNPNTSYADNQIATSKYTWLTFLPKNLFEQFHRYANLYFLAIQVLNWLPGINVFVREVQLIPLLFVLSVTLIKDVFEDRRRHNSDKRVNNLKCRRYDQQLKRFVQIAWKDIRVGDLIHLSCNEKVPADILLLKSQSAEDDDDYGTCYVETANLDGESNLKQRYVVKGFSKANEQLEDLDFNFVVECDKPNMKLHKFHGILTFKNPNKSKIPLTKDNLLLRDCVLKNTSFIEGLVIYAGHETKAMLNNKGPRHKISHLERMMNADIIWCIMILLIMCTVSALGRKFWLDRFVSVNKDLVPFLSAHSGAPIPQLEFLWTFFTFIILYQMIIPISLYVCIEMVKLGQVYYIHRDEQLYDRINQKRVECRALNITEDLGQVEYMFCDKTGTLTENMMQFRCCTIKGIDYSHECITDSSCNITYEESFNALKRKSLKLNIELQEKVKLITDHYEKVCKKLGMNLENSSENSSNTSIDMDYFKLTAEEEITRDFFVLLAICNTAVATDKNAHKDMINAKGDSRERLDRSRLRENSQNSTTKAKNNNQQEFNNNLPFGSSNTPRKLFRLFNGDKAKSPAGSRKSKPIYESESPDEVALVTAAFNYRVALLKRTKEQVQVMLPNGAKVTYQVLDLLPFDSNRKRMSIIVRCPLSNRIVLLCKGSDLTVLQNLSSQFENDPEKKSELIKTQQNLKHYSTKGFRVLCMARRVLSEEEYNEWQLQYQQTVLDSNDSTHKLNKCIDDIESNLELLGATAIEDKLQYRVPDVIASLKAAGIIIWVLTGDKMETAINIANSCSLFNSKMQLIEISLDSVKSKSTAQVVLIEKIAYIRQTIRDNKVSIDQEEDNHKTQPESWLQRYLRILYEVLNWHQKSNLIKQKERSHWGLVIDGPSLNFVLDKDNLNLFVELTQYCGSVLCCRATPSQKAAVVKSVKKKLNTLTMAVGDGANDVAMIQTAHVGVGISGLEGTQAVMASDFAVSKFHHLERLILVHGNLCYNRLALTILYFFYKNTLVVFVILFFQFCCGFSGQSVLDDIYLMAVNICYTTFPAMVRGVFEKDFDEQVFLEHPSLYERGRASQVYTTYSFWVNTTDSIYQSLVIYYSMYFVYYDSKIGIYELGMVLFTLIIVTNLLQIAMETKFWNSCYMWSFVLSFGCFFSTVAFLDMNYAYYIVATLGGHNYKVYWNLMHNFKFWLSLVVTPVLCLIPRCTLRFIQEMIKPQIKI